MQDTIKIYLSPFKIFYMFLGSIFFTASSLVIYLGDIINPVYKPIAILGVVFFGIVAVLNIASLYKLSSPCIEFTKQGFIRYNRVTKKPVYFIPREFLLGIYYDLKRPSFFTLLLMPHNNDEQYRTKLKNIELPESFKNCPQKVPVITLNQIVIKFYTERLDFIKHEPLIKKYFNVEDN